MKWKCVSGIIIPLLGLSLFASARGGNYSACLDYSRATKFSSFKKKTGPILGIAPFRDQRSDKAYIGRYTLSRNLPGYFTSQPVPLEKAVQDCLRKALIRSGVETIPVTGWDGKPESMNGMNVDSILMIVIKKFWVEGRVVSLRTKMHASIHLIFYLGIKKLDRVFIQNVFVEKNRTFRILAPQGMVEWINRTLADTLDAFLLNPY
jgi:hypothetical protein